MTQILRTESPSSCRDQNKSHLERRRADRAAEYLRVAKAC